VALDPVVLSCEVAIAAPTKASGSNVVMNRILRTCELPQQVRGQCFKNVVGVWCEENQNQNQRDFEEVVKNWVGVRCEENQNQRDLEEVCLFENGIGIWCEQKQRDSKEYIYMYVCLGGDAIF